MCTWIGAALGEWQQEHQVRRKKADWAAMVAKRRARQAAARLAGGHRLDWTRDGWRCRYCGTTARTTSGARRVHERPCEGHTAARIPRQANLGAAAHVLWTAEADDTQRQVGADVTWCSICGASSSNKVYKLRGECTGPADKAARTRLRALQNLRHPVLGYRLKKPYRTTDALMDAMEERGDERRRLYQAALQSKGDDGKDECPEGEISPAARLAPLGHSAGSDDGERTEPLGHVATPSDVHGDNTCG